MKLKNLTPEKVGMVKGGAAVGLLAGIGIFFLCRHYEKTLDQLELDTAEFCIENTARNYESIIRKMKQPKEESEEESL